MPIHEFPNLITKPNRTNSQEWRKSSLPSNKTAIMNTLDDQHRPDVIGKVFSGGPTIDNESDPLEMRPEHKDSQILILVRKSNSIESGS